MISYAEYESLAAAVAAEHGLPAAWFEFTSERCDHSTASERGSKGADESNPNSTPSTASPTRPSDLRLLRLRSENLVRPGGATDSGTVVEGNWELDAFADTDWTVDAVIRLLLLGTRDESVRTIGFPPKVLTATEYVRGGAGEWPGLLASTGSSGVEPAKVRIQGELAIGDRRLVVERSWIALRSDWREDLVVDGDERVEGADASTLLDGILPGALVPLCIFDGFDALGAVLSPMRLRSDLDRLLPRSVLDALHRRAYGDGVRPDPKIGMPSPTTPFLEGWEALRMQQAKTQAVVRHDETGRQIRWISMRLLEALRERAHVDGLLRTMLGRTASRSYEVGDVDGSRTRPRSGGSSAVDHSGASVNRSFLDRLQQRSMDLRIEIVRLTERLETARIEGRMWSDMIVARQRALDAIRAAGTPEDGGLRHAAQSDRPATFGRAVREIEGQLRDRIRRTVGEELATLSVRLEVPLPAPFASPAHNFFGPVPVSSPGTSVCEADPTGLDMRIALTLRLAILKASRWHTPMYITLDGRTLSKEERSWLETRFRPVLPPGSLLWLSYGRSPA